MSDFKPIEKRGRGWLEPHNLGVDSYVTWLVEVADRYESCELKIADCNRNVTLYFTLDGDALDKLDRLLTHLNEFRSSIVRAQKLLDKRP